MPKGNPIPALDRIIDRSDMSGDCWLWLGGCYGSGYGQITEYVDHRPHKYTVHRLVYERMVEPIPDGLVLDHLCFVRNCFNPDHLEIVTRAENTRRGAHRNSVVIANRAKTHCPRNHPYDEENTYVNNGGRYCRACGREASKRYLQRKRREAR